MPVITVYGLPFELDQNQVEEAEAQLKSAAAGISVLGIKTTEVSILFPVCRGGARELIATVDGLFSKPDRNGHPRQQLAMAIGLVLNKYAKGRLVEVFVHQPFDAQNGFYSSAK